MIKLFEEYNEYYQEVSIRDLPESEDLVNINYSLFLYIKDRLEDKDRVESRIRVQMDSIDDYYTKYIIVYYYDRAIMSIIELDDDWFFICDLRGGRDGRKDYKCDQVEGVIKYLDDHVKKVF